MRAALAAVVMELAPQLGKQPTIEHLVPVFLSLLKDPNPDVRLNVISKLDQVGEGAGLQGLGRLQATWTVCGAAQQTGTHPCWGQ